MPKTILVVDDNIINRRLLSKTLCEDYAVLEAVNGKEALALAEANHKTLSAVLTDIVMPEMDGYALLAAIRGNVQLAPLPVIMVTGSEDEESRLKALTMGANDFVVKPFSPEIIRHCVKNNIALRETASILNAIQKDKLTGLYNREAFFERAGAAVREREPGYYILSSFDIDNFKLINDQFGTLEGDRILREIGRAVSEDMAQVGGIAGRISGDNFAVLLPAKEKELSINRLVQQNRMAFSDKQAVVFSIGRYVVTDPALPASALYDRAYIAKLSIKGRYDEHIAYFGDAMLDRLIRGQQIIADMDAAISEHQFEVWFQPQRNHATGALVGAEALVRWRHPQKGMISPGEFIPVFEQNGFIYELDKYVWEEACRCLRKWMDEGRKPLPLSVNISRYDIFRTDFIETLTGTVKKYGVPVELLRLEITESAFAESTKRIVEIVRVLIARGFTIEIDDFGSGYSSLNTLKNVPAQVIKLDMRFLEDDDGSGRGGNILESIVRMAKWLDMAVIAEGVEDKEQADYLASIGCGYIQGYLYARPMPLAAYEAYCENAGKEERLLSMDTVASLNNLSFWDPRSMDTLIFNSYVGAACIFEYHLSLRTIELLRVNAKFAALLGDGSLSVEDTLKLHWLSCLTQEGRELVRDMLRRSGETGEECTGEYQFNYITPNQPRTYLRSTMRVIAAAGERMLVYCTSENITAQRVAEESARDSAQRMQAVLDNIDAGVTATLLDGDKTRILFANDRHYEMLGYAREQYQKQYTGIPNRILDADRDMLTARCAVINESGRPDSVIFRIRRADNAIRWMRAGITRMRYPGIDVPVLLSITQDITEQKQTEEQVSRLSAQLQAIMDNVDLGIIAAVVENGEARYLFANNRYYQMLGYTQAQFESEVTSPYATIAPEDRARMQSETARINAIGQTAMPVYTALRRDGSRRVFRAAISVAVLPGIANPTQFSIVRDITEEEETQRALLDNLPGGAGLYEYENGRLTVRYLNKSYWDLVGREATSYEGLDAIAAVHPEDRAAVARELAAAVSQERNLSCDFRLRHETQTYYPVHLMARIVPNGPGAYLFYATFTPISAETMSLQEMLPVAIQAMMDSSSEVAFVKDKDLRYISCSRQFALLSGYASESELLGKRSCDVLPPDLAAQNDADDLRILQSKQSRVDFDILFPTVHGNRRLLFSKYPLLDAQGNTLGIYGTGHDVTETRTIRSRLEMLANNIPGGIAIYEGTDGAPEHVRLTYFSDGLCRMFGFTREEYQARTAENPFSLILPEDLPTMVDGIARLIRDNVPIDYIYRARARDGQSKWINVRAVQGEQNNDRLTVNAVFFDVTVRENALAKLRVSEKINRLALEQSGSTVCQYDIAARQLTVSPRISPIFELAPREENIPESALRAGRISPETADAYKALFAGIQRGDKSGEALIQRRSTMGWRWVREHYTTIFSDAGTPVTAVIAFDDVTDSIERDMAYQKWQQSIRDRAPDSYSLFHCNISKNIVLDATEGLLLPREFTISKTNLSERTETYARQCVCAEDRASYLAMMDRSQQLMRHNQGKRTDSLEYRESLPEGGTRWLRLTVDLVALPSSSDVEAYLLFENIDQAKRTELDMQARAQNDPLTGLLNRQTFADQFESAMRENERGALSALFILDLDGFKQVNDRFGHAAGDETLIEMGQKLRSAFRGKDMVCRLGGDEFMVYMNGVAHINAIKERAALLCALLHKSFSLEVQLSASIGIALCPEHGADFATLYRKADAALYHVKANGKDSYALYTEDMGEKPLTAPCAQAEEPADPAEAAEPDDGAYASPKRRMLIVEDNEINRDYLSSLFEDEFIIDTAAEGTAALIRLKRYGAGVSVVLLDLMMPGLDGFSVLKKMRADIATQAIPVIVVSGMNERENCLRAIREGASDFVTKPVDADILKLRVASALSKAENEHLRAQNRYLALQNEESKRLTEAKRHSEELSIALHAAERADLAKSQFLSSMSHEIRTPLNAVIGYNTIARNELNEARSDAARRQVGMKVMDCLTKSEVASRHLLTIINDVLDMSAIESGKMKVDSVPFDFRSLVTSLTVLFFSQARAKGVDFEVLFDKPTEEWFVGDPLRINQILTNLLSNAVKFTPDGGRVTLNITERALDKDATGFCFVVADTGIGMTSEYLRHIWTPFEQAEASISRRFGGTGLGLSITKNLVDLMQGDIQVKSQPGVGSTFTVRLTLKRTQQPQKPADYDFSHINALVVDDDASTCDYIKLLFDRCGARCATYTAGAPAVEAFTAALAGDKPFNMCLIDWRMPQMDGFATISEIRRAAGGSLPIVVVTAYDFSEIADQAQKLGISRFISKPLFQSSLFDLLSTITGKRAVPTSDKKPRHNFNGARVLLAEDNNMNMEVARHILLSAGIAVDSAWNGQEAVDIFTASQPGTYKALLMDVHMPLVNGYQATQIIRACAHPDAQTIPIIAMTADVFAQDIAEARSAGMNDHIAKPININALFKVLANYMEDKGNA